MFYVIMRTLNYNKHIGRQSYPTLEILLPYLGAQSAHLRNSSYHTFTDKVTSGLWGKYSHYGGPLRCTEGRLV